MERMLCEDCSAVTYSAAATLLIEHGQRCPQCGGPLGLGDDARVTVPADGEREKDAEPPEPPATGRT